MPRPPQVGDPLADWTTSSISGSLHKLTLAKLQPDSLYEVEMAAKNCAGLGQPAMMTFRTGKGTGGSLPQNSSSASSPPFGLKPSNCTWTCRGNDNNCVITHEQPLYISSVLLLDVLLILMMIFQLIPELIHFSVLCFHSQVGRG